MVISQIEQINKWLRYQLDDSTAKKFDDHPFPLSKIVYFNILDAALLNKVSNMLNGVGVIFIINFNL